MNIIISKKQKCSSIINNNENDIQIISNILYNDMSVLLLSVGFTLFISLILIVNKRS